MMSVLNTEGIETSRLGADKMRLDGKTLLTPNRSGEIFVTLCVLFNYHHWITTQVVRQLSDRR